VAGLAANSLVTHDSPRLRGWHGSAAQLIFLMKMVWKNIEKAIFV